MTPLLGSLAPLHVLPLTERSLPPPLPRSLERFRVRVEQSCLIRGNPPVRCRRAGGTWCFGCGEWPPSHLFGRARL